MTDHLQALRDYNDWRRGRGDSAKYDGIQKQLGEHIDAVINELESLRKNEYICKKCSLRKDSDHPKGDF